MTNLPDRMPGLEPSPQLRRAVAAQQRTELAIYEHHLQTRYLADCDQIDSQAVAEVTKAALDEELSLLDWGLEQAGGSAAKVELVSRHVSQLSRLNVSRIARHFGG